MITICWNNHQFEDLQDQTSCPRCGEFGQHSYIRRFPSLQAQQQFNKSVKEIQQINLDSPQYNYDRGYRDGFEAGVIAQKKVI